MTKPKVFISYSQADVDKEWLRAFIHSLETRGVSVWFDESQLHPGDSIRDAVEEGLRSSDIIVAVVSPNSLERPNLFFELGAAVGMGKRVVAIVPSDLDPSRLPQLLRTRKFLVQGPPEEAARALVSETSEQGHPA
jgi:predicted nucleotide-binding protein